MGRYVNAAYISDRYPAIQPAIGAEILETAFILPAEAHVDGALSIRFTPPFSSNNQTVKDLAADLAYAAATAGKTKTAESFEKRALAKIQALLDGRMNMATTDGQPVLPDVVQAFSTNQNYTPVFGLSPYEHQEYDPDQVADEEGRRS